MIAVDTNVLLHAHRRDSEFHDRAADVLRGLAAGRAQWAIPWPCVHEFYAIATHPRVFDPPTTCAEALDQVDAWVESPSLVLLSEEQRHWTSIRELLENGRVTGPLVHDARVAAICLSHGVRELLTADRDFGRFPRLVTRNPLTG